MDPIVAEVATGLAERIEIPLRHSVGVRDENEHERMI